MFHIAFEYRHVISVQRYSFPGYPCLYLGSSVAVCCNEIGNHDPDVNIAEYKLHCRNYNVLDLCFFENYDFSSLTEQEFDRFLLLWPLVVCCSFRYQDVNKMRFRPDYIIPQMVLEYIIDSNLDEILFSDGDVVPIHGIRYCSVKKLPTLLQNGAFNENLNYVFPVQQINSTGFCPVLAHDFEIVSVKHLEDI